MDFRKTFDNKTALVTGASSGIGKAIAIELGRYGAHVICVARTLEKLQETTAIIAEFGAKAYPESLDVTDPIATEKLASKIGKIHNSLEFAYLNAGGQTEISNVVESNVDTWRYDIELNMFSVYYGIRYFANLMKKQGGKIVFTGSGLAQNVRAEYSSYCSSKAGARMLARVAAQELACHNITINELVPGPVITPLTTNESGKKSTGPAFGNPIEWIKNPEDVVDLALSIAALPGKGPTGQIFSLMRR